MVNTAHAGLVGAAGVVHVVRGVMSNSRLRRLLLAYAGAAVSEWAVWLAVLVYAQERSGSTAAGWMALLLLAPLVVAAPFAARAFAGPSPVRVLRLVFTGQTVMLLISAVLAAIEAPLVLLAVPAAFAIGGIAFVRPGQAVLTPGIVRTAGELTTANLFVGYVDSACVLLGPIIATAFLAAGGAPTVLGVCAVFAVGGVLAVTGGERLVAPVHAAPSGRRPAEQPTAERTSLWRVVSALRGREHVVVLLFVFTLQHVLMGVLGLMFVVLAVDELGMGSSGAGVLNIAFGIGALLSGLGSTFLAGRGRLAPMVAGALAAMTVATLALGLVVVVPVAIIALAAAGFGRSLLDVSARMLLQRSVPSQHLSATFAIIEVLTSVGLAIGTIASQVIVATVGAPTGLVVCGALFLVALVASAPLVWQADRSADVPVVAVALLRSVPLFAPLPAATLEAVARSGVERHHATGSVLMRQGEPGDVYHAIADGTVEVAVDGTPVRRLSRGHGVGEVALLADTPRTATVTAAEPTHTLEIARHDFLLAVTGNDLSMRTAHRQIEDFVFPTDERPA